MLEYIENTGTQWIDTGCVPAEGCLPPSQRHIDLSAFFRAHKAMVDENNHVTMEVICDGTLLFLAEMLYVLKAIGCADIDYDGKTVSEGIPEDKPWCNYLYTAKGVLPDGVIFYDGVLYRRTEGIT